MPRKNGIYRTIKGLTVTGLCVNLRTGETYTDEFNAPVIKDKVALLKYLEKEYNTSKMRIVKVKKVVEKEKQYFLSIEKFLKYAIESEVK